MKPFVVPEPPSVNRYWRKWRNRMVRSPLAASYQKTVWHMALLAGLKPLEGDVAVTLWWKRVANRGDLDNRIKVVLDALQGAAYHDDKQVVELHAYTVAAETPCMVIEVEQRNGK